MHHAQWYRMVNLRHKGKVLILEFSSNSEDFLQPKSSVLRIFDNLLKNNCPKWWFFGLKLLKTNKISNSVPCPQIDHSVALCHGVGGENHQNQEEFYLGSLTLKSETVHIIGGPIMHYAKFHSPQKWPLWALLTRVTFKIKDQYFNLISRFGALSRP